MCQMKRDVLAKTGIWYHGSQEGQPAFPPKALQKKMSVSEIESSENDVSFYQSFSLDDSNRKLTDSNVHDPC